MERMTIDEAIAEQRDNAKTQREIAEECFEEHIFDEKERIEHHKYADEFEQLAEWLEELKFRRVLQLQCEKEYFAGYEKGKNEGYNKAIDDMLKMTKSMEFRQGCIQSSLPLYEYLEIKAKQLKVGGENE